MTGMLASVSTLDEAIHVAGVGVDIIDLKAPAAGALGALKLADICHIKKTLGNRHVVSATIGDLPVNPAVISTAVRGMQTTGVDYVKIGFFPGGDWLASIHALTELAADGTKLIAVFFGDKELDPTWIKKTADAGFTGVMLDTLDKQHGALPEICSGSELTRFIAKAKQFGLLVGLAGSLRLRDIPSLLKLNPDYLGFRGALCKQQRRIDDLDPSAVRLIRASIPTF